MAIHYWDPDWTSTTDTSTGWDINCTNTDTAASRYEWVVRTYLVEAPAHWTEEDQDAFTRLVNIETHTGFKVVMWIRGGDILITDPNVERRTMADFVPLLKAYGSQADRDAINAFFDEHGLEPPEEPAAEAAEK
jgi:hypothetical protein